LWLQIKADITGMPVERPVVIEAAVVGATMLAAVGCGDFHSIAESSDRLYRVERVFQPDRSNAAVYEQAYHEYRRLQQVLFPV
jgi:xylulokinase